MDHKLIEVFVDKITKNIELTNVSYNYKKLLINNNYKCYIDRDATSNKFNYLILTFPDIELCLREYVSEISDKIEYRILKIVERELRKRISKDVLIPDSLKISLENLLNEYVKQYLTLVMPKLFYSWNYQSLSTGSSYITFPVYMGIGDIKLEVETNSPGDFDLDLIFYRKNNIVELHKQFSFKSTYGIREIRLYLSRFIRDHIKKFFEGYKKFGDEYIKTI